MRARRSYGILCLLDVVCWALSLALLVLGGIVGVFAALLGASQALTPSAETERQGDIAFGVLLVLVVGALALVLVTLVLDLVVTVMSLRRLGGDGSPRAVPVLALVGIGLGTAVPLLLLGAAVVAGVLEAGDLALSLWWLLGGALVVLAPWARLGQLIGGALDLSTAPSPSRRPGVGPLP